MQRTTKIAVGGVLVVLAAILVTVTVLQQHGERRSVVGTRPIEQTSSAELIHVYAVGGTLITPTAEFGRGSKYWASATNMILNGNSTEPTKYNIIGRANDNSGFATKSTKGLDLATAALLNTKPDANLVVVASSLNDPQQSVGRGIDQLFASVRQRGKSIPILVLGPIVVDVADLDKGEQVGEAIRVAVERNGGQYFDAIAAGWFRNRDDLLAPDKLRLNNDGQLMFARLIAPLIAKEARG